MFSWMPAGNSGGYAAMMHDLMVSILVLVDACRKLLLGSGKTFFDILFQSLFSWMPAGNNGVPVDMPVMMQVSILVLVDACRKP